MIVMRVAPWAAHVVARMVAQGAGQVAVGPGWWVERVVVPRVGSGAGRVTARLPAQRTDCVAVSWVV